MIRRLFPIVGTFLVAFSNHWNFAQAAELILESPVDLQVVQRDAQGLGEVVVAGRAGRPVNELRCRVVNGDSSAVTVIHASLGPSFRVPVRVPAGGWYRVEVSAFADGWPVGSNTVARVGVGEVFVVAGQSNAGNHGSERTKSATGRVSQFDGKQWRPAEDPMRGASGGGGSFMPSFGDALVEKLGVPVGLVPVAVGATSVREWLPSGTRMTNQPTTGANVKLVGSNTWEATGGLFQNLADRLAPLGTNGCRAVLWHQGESDAGQARNGYPADRQITGDQYAAFLGQLIRASRAKAGWDMPWLTAQTTYHSEKDAADEEFRAAQRSLWTSGLARPGPDTDALRAGLRDGVHFNAAGLQRHGELWAERVMDVIEAR